MLDTSPRKPAQALRRSDPVKRSIPLPTAPTATSIAFELDTARRDLNVAREKHEIAEFVVEQMEVLLAAYRAREIVAATPGAREMLLILLGVDHCDCECCCDE